MSWRDKARSWVPPTLRETVAAMQLNAERAEQARRNAVADTTKFQPGDPRLGQAMEDVGKYAAEEPHWRAYGDYYRGLLQRYHDLADRPALEAVKREKDSPAPAKVLPMRETPHWSEPAAERVPGGDDFEEPLPF